MYANLWVGALIVLTVREHRDLPTSADQAWTYIQDVPAVFACVPGSRLIDRRVDGSYSMGITFSAAGVRVEFLGTAEVALSDATRMATVNARGRDHSRMSRATATIRLLVEQNLDHGSLSVEADLDLSGPLGGMVTTVGRSTMQRLMAGFADCLSERLSQATPRGSALIEEP